jgi:hypothetical protein
MTVREDSHTAVPMPSDARLPLTPELSTWENGSVSPGRLG